MGKCAVVCVSGVALMRQRRGVRGSGIRPCRAFIWMATVGNFWVSAMSVVDPVDPTGEAERMRPEYVGAACTDLPHCVSHSQGTGRSASRCAAELAVVRCVLFCVEWQ